MGLIPRGQVHRGLPSGTGGYAVLEPPGALVPQVAPAVIAKCMHPRHNTSMSVQITIRKVPEKVRDELAARAALEHKSMQEYLLGELQRLAERPSVDRWLEQVRERKQISGRRVSASRILRHRDADRR